MVEDRYARVTLAFLHRKKRLGTMLKILTKLVSSHSKVFLAYSTLRIREFLYCNQYISRVVGGGGFFTTLSGGIAGFLPPVV